MNVGAATLATLAAATLFGRRTILRQGCVDIVQPVPMLAVGEKSSAGRDMADIDGQAIHSVKCSRMPAFLLHALSYMRELPSNRPIDLRSELVACGGG